MLRIGGPLALLASAALAVLLLTHVRSFQGTGLLVAREDGTLGLCMHQALPFGEGLRGYTPMEQMDPDGLVHRLRFPSPDAFQGTVGVDVDLRVLTLRWPRWFFDGASVGNDAAAYRCTRSIPAFYLTLAFLSAVPLLLWAVAALISVAAGGRKSCDTAFSPL